MITILSKKTDEIGALSSTLCMLHCIATPLLLALVPGSSMAHHGSQEWWSWLDIVFLIISAIAVFNTFRQCGLRWLRISLVANLLMLTFFILNERLEGIEFPFDMVYLPAFALIVLHLINRRNCRCEVERFENSHSKGEFM